MVRHHSGFSSLDISDWHNSLREVKKFLQRKEREKRFRSLCTPVLPGGRGHRQITQIRPYKKIICGEKLVAVKVAVSSNKVL
jgi:hypothetical protein